MKKEVGRFAIFVLGLALTSAQAQEAVTEPVLIEANRLPNAESSAPFSVNVVDAEDLREAPQLALDDILRAQAPGFSLFRRSSSRTANPTTQGVTLRNFGPSGAGRTLVLLDGIPLNDPFAGYVLWSQVPPSSIQSVLITPGGGAGLFGNAALAGTIFLISKPLDQDSAVLEGAIGNENTYQTSLDGVLVSQPFALAVVLERFATSGYPVLKSSQRGKVDNNGSSDSDLIDLHAQWQISSDTSLSLRGRWFNDERGNGTVFTHNDTTGEDFSAVITQKFAPLQAELQLSAYGQIREFNSTFSSINATRDVETPALDQFDVPADAAGGSAVWSMVAGEHRIVAGADARWVTGETNEHYLWNGTAFTRLRRAGGDQIFAGIFGEDTWSISSNTTIVGGLRLDHWDLIDGFRKESIRATGAILTDSKFADRDDFEVNGRIGARVQATKTFALRGAFYSGFRVPTLNELYRPFRVGNDVTEANPALQPEHLLGGELAFEWQATPTFSITATGFLNRLEDAVSNVTIGMGPGTFNPGGFIPAGGVLRQRQNVDLVVAPGAEATARWQVIPSLTVKAGYLFTHPTIAEAADPTLEGKLLAQTPEHVLTCGVEWRPVAKWLVNTQVRYSDRQFEDDQNSRVLAPFTTIDAAVSYEYSDHLSTELRVENLLDAEIQTGKSANGLISIGAPRLISLQVRWQL